jgi:iron complex transport system substrate-binding protein
MSDLRIVSFLPAATEMVFTLGFGDHLAGVSHECDFPAAARSKPIVVRPALALEKMSLREIDRAVSERLHRDREDPTAVASPTGREWRDEDRDDRCGI